MVQEAEGGVARERDQERDEDGNWMAAPAPAPAELEKWKERRQQALPGTGRQTDEAHPRRIRGGSCSTLRAERTKPIQGD